MKTTKKSLAFILALVMILTLIPASAFAATSNEVTKVVTVAADDDMPTVGMDLRVTNSSGIKEDTVQTVNLSLENATWVNGEDAELGLDKDLNVYAKDKDGGDVALDSTIQVYGDNSIELTMKMGADLPKDGYFHFNMNLTAGSDAGEVKVKLESIDSDISGGTFVVAVVAGGDTVAKVVNDPKKVTRGGGQVGANIEIREAAVTAISGEQKIKLTLPKGFAWDEAKTDVEGTMLKGTAAMNADGRDLYIDFDTNGNKNVRETLVVKPVFSIDRDAKMGDVDVQLRTSKGDITEATGLTVAVYGDDAVTVSAVKEKDIPTIEAGFETKDDGGNYKVTVILEEVTQGSLIDGKYVEFAFPEWVQVVSEGAISTKLNGAAKATNDPAGPITDNGKFKIKDDNSVVEWTVDRDKFNANKTNKVEFEFPVTVEAGHSGDLEVTVSGPKAGVAETTLVVGKIVQPITAEVKLGDVRTGIQKQKGGDIVIKETEAGLIRDDKGDKITVAIDSLSFDGMNFDDATVKVTKGDLELGKKVDVTKGVIVIPIDRASIKEAAEITISDVTLNLDRTMPEGKYAVKIAGPAVIDNADYNDGDFAGNAVKADYVNIITRADSNVYGEAKFKIGDKGYSVLVNGELQKFEMDTAAFTKDSRTMIPVKYVMLALGGKEEDVVWNQAAQTATFFKGDRVCVIKIGSNVMTVNGAEVVMDTAAFTKDQRTFVPIKFVATALGCTVSWDAATETVTINQ